MNAALRQPLTEAALARRVIKPAITFAPASFTDLLWSALLWVLGVAWLVPSLTLLLLLHQLLPSDVLYPIERVYVWVQLRLLLLRYRPRVHPEVDPRTQYVFMCTHINHADHVTMVPATKHFKQGLELKDHFRYPFYGWFMKARGTIGVERTRGAGQSPEVLDAFRRELDRGHSILAFPEGTRTTTGRVGHLRKGTFFIARDLGAPIVPVAVTGMYEVMRKGSLLLRPFQTVTVIYDQPIPTAGLTDDEIPDLVAHVEAVLSDHVDAYWAQKGLDEGGCLT